ncbi:MAG: hypothetical protein ACRDRG_21795 [Pseudonocardiaceae bacterium]
MREQVVQLLHREANQLLHGGYSEKTGKALLSAVATATKTAGWMSGDVGRHSPARRYYIQALDLAVFRHARRRPRDPPGGAGGPAELRIGQPRGRGSLSIPSAGSEVTWERPSSVSVIPRRPSH